MVLDFYHPSLDPPRPFGGFMLGHGVEGLGFKVKGNEDLNLNLGV